MKTYVLYHNNCADGFGAATAAWMALGDGATYIPINYGSQPPPLDKDSRVYLLDFTFPRHWMEDLIDLMQEVIVLDHHKTAEEALKGLEEWANINFDLTHSGAYLAWQHFHPDEPTPPVVLFLEDRDLWKWELGSSREVSAAIWSYPFDFRLWSEWFADPFAAGFLASEGQAILRYMSQQTQVICSRAKLENFLDHIVPVVNATTLFSEVGERLLSMFPDAPFAVAWFINDDHQLQWSLRSRPGFDVSAIAKRLGGGGHAQAAGAQEEWLDDHLP